MPIERREILMHPDEVLRAIENYGLLTPGLLPIGALCSATIAPAAGGFPRVTALVRMPAEPDEEDVEVCLSDSSVLEMLIQFCLAESIPIPRFATKTCTVVDDMLTLVIENRHDINGARP